MKAAKVRKFLKLFAWIAPLNAVVTTVSLSLHLGWVSGALLWVAIGLNFPTILLVIVAKEFWEKFDVNWYITIPLLTLVGSLLWAWAIVFIWAIVDKRKNSGTAV